VRSDSRPTKLLRDWFGIEEGELTEKARKRVTDRTEVLGGSLAQFLPIVFEFLGVPDPANPAPQLTPEAREYQIKSFLRELVRRESLREPLVIYLDDAHWIDAASDRLAASLVEAVVGSSALLLLNFRPEYRAEWMSRADYQQLPLSALTAKETDALLEALLGAPRSRRVRWAASSGKPRAGIPSSWRRPCARSPTPASPRESPGTTD
jgi:adenylate cyclase